MGCMYSVKPDGRVELMNPQTNEVFRYDNVDLCIADQTYTMAVAFLFGIALLLLKCWLVVVIFYYSRELRI